MFCNQCGAQINDNARFCPKCGQATGIQAPVKKETKKKNVVKLPSAQKITDAFKTFVRGFFSVFRKNGKRIHPLNCQSLSDFRRKKLI